MRVYIHAPKIPYGYYYGYITFRRRLPVYKERTGRHYRTDKK